MFCISYEKIEIEIHKLKQEYIMAVSIEPMFHKNWKMNPILWKLKS